MPGRRRRLVRISSGPDRRPDTVGLRRDRGINRKQRQPSRFRHSPALFRENVSRELERGGRWIALVPPGLARAPEPFDTAEVNALIRVYAGVLAELVKARGGIALDVRAVADRLGPAAFDADGMHLTRAAYQELVPEIADAIEASTQ